MDLGWIVAVSGFALAMAGTPGPNNTMVTASGANHGFRRTLPFMTGITLGVTAIILAVGAAGSSLVADPHVRDILKWTGLAYLLWLAWKIANAPTAPSAADDSRTRGKPLTLMQGALLQVVNPKLWVMVAGAVVTYGDTATNASTHSIALAFGVIFGIATFASVMAWTLVGAGAARVLRTPRHMRAFNVAMSALLVVSLIPVMRE